MPSQRDLFLLIFDTSSLINIERTNKMHCLKKIKSRILIPRKVAIEVSSSATGEKKPLAKMTAKYPDMVTDFQKNEEAEYLKIRAQIGIHDTDAAAIAMAVCRGLPLVIDDKKAKAKAELHGVETLSWLDFINK